VYFDKNHPIQNPEKLLSPNSCKNRFRNQTKISKQKIEKEKEMNQKKRGNLPGHGPSG
jgi:hypothetical protein